MISKNIFILIIFLSIVLIISEIWNLFENNFINFDIKNLCTNDLKMILKFRGVKYKGIFEKSELLDLISETGKLTRFEWNSARTYHTDEGKCSTVPISVIPNEDLFNELVEDSKDSAWILMTIFPKSTTPFSDEHRKKLEDVWCNIQSRYVRFGINMAVLDCGQLYNLCWDRGFHRSPFVLVLPRGRTKIKDSVDFFIFPYSNSIVEQETVYIQQTVTSWLNNKMAHRVNQAVVSDIDNNNMEKNIFEKFPVNFISIYPNKSRIDGMPPTSVSGHSVKFTGRIHFWSGLLTNVPTVFIDRIFESFPNWSSPGHFFITKNRLVYQYGLKDGQSLSYDALELFFRDLCPSTNDLFVASLVLINLIVSFQLSLQQGSLALKLGYFLWYFLIFNLLFCSLFLFFISSLNLSENLNGLTSLWQRIAVSPFSEHIRYLQLTDKLNVRLMGVVWLIMSLVIGIIVWIRSEVEEQQQAQPETENLSNPRPMEPWDPEAGHQIAFLNSLGIFNLTLQQQPPLYLSKLLNWSFEVPQKWASKIAHRCRDSKMAAKLSSLCDLHKSSGHEDSEEISSDLSANEMSTLSKPDCLDRLKWPRGYIFTNTCCICLQRYRQNEILCGLPCGHAFHDMCIKEWLIQWAKDDCPQCRWPAYKDKAY